MGSLRGLRRSSNKCWSGMRRTSRCVKRNFENQKTREEILVTMGAGGPTRSKRMAPTRRPYPPKPTSSILHSNSTWRISNSLLSSTVIHLSLVSRCPRWAIPVGRMSLAAEGGMRFCSLSEAQMCTMEVTALTWSLLLSNPRSVVQRPEARRKTCTLTPTTERCRYYPTSIGRRHHAHSGSWRSHTSRLLWRTQGLLQCHILECGVRLQCHRRARVSTVATTTYPRCRTFSTRAGWERNVRREEARTCRCSGRASFSQINCQIAICMLSPHLSTNLVVLARRRAAMIRTTRTPVSQGIRARARRGASRTTLWARRRRPRRRWVSLDRRSQSQAWRRRTRCHPPPWDRRCLHARQTMICI
mmetsp:Transcript_3408/g.8581  ORF Transcript_3408/g.8581 Transcript_3408/m.8581 type:complete len:359 (+) Transcript_3408:164-1240(+)